MNVIAGSARLGATDADYQWLGLDPKMIAPWEDGRRMDVGSGSWEWWYFDAHLDDGATLVLGFYTKPPILPGLPLSPVITINLALPDGRQFDRKRPVEPDAFSASKDGCDVRIAENRFSGDLKTYHIEANFDEISVVVDLESDVPSWRPRTGHRLFERNGETHVFAWFPSVPQGRVNVTYQIGDESFVTTGTGYHDHNWGDAAMQALIHDWYWTRARIGPFTVIASNIVAEEAYGSDQLKAFLLAKDGKIVADDETKVRFETEGVFVDETTGKPVANIIRFLFEDGGEKYAITFAREATILSEKFGKELPLSDAEIAGIGLGDACYQRFTGKASIERLENGQATERHENEAIWEMMYFGEAPVPEG